MLEKIGLPAKPSARGNNWVVDASHCQGCSSQFTFFNRKHHCRRCGGLFCNTCTQQRMILRGQGDSAVRICDPCKKLEDAARFELRHKYKNGKAKSTSKLPPMQEDEILKKNLEANGASSSSSSDIVTESTEHDELSPVSPEDIRKQAFEEKKRYKILKGEGKSREAIQAYKRGKELDRQAAALEITIRKNNGLASVQKRSEAVAESKQFPSQKVKRQKDDVVSELRELGWSDADLHDTDKKAEDSITEDKLSKLLGEIPQTPPVGRHSSGIDKTQVIAHKKKALMLKKEGKLAEAKEELKQAKILEKQLEEQELLAEDEVSDDELSILIRSVNDGKEDVPSLHGISGLDLNMNQIKRLEDDDAVVSNFDVTDDDMNDAEIMSTLKSFGWSEDDDAPVDNGKQKKEKEAKLIEKNLQNPMAEKQHSEPSSSLYISISPYENGKPPQKSKRVIQRELLNLKKKALALRREGHVEEAEEELKKGKDLERQLEEMDNARKVTETDIGVESVQKSEFQDQMSEKQHSEPSSSLYITRSPYENSKPPQKSKLVIQKELLNLRKKALALRREGHIEEAEEELKKGKDLERQLEEMDNARKVTETDISVEGIHKSAPVHQYPSLTSKLLEEDDVAEVTDKDMMDPSFLSTLQNLGWEEDARRVGGGNVSENRENHASFVNEPSIIPKKRARDKAEIQRELLSVKRKALALRRQGKLGEAEEVLRKAKDLDNELAETEVTLPSEFSEFSGDSGSLLPAKKPENLMRRKGDRDGEEDIIPDYSLQDPSLMLNLSEEPVAEVTEKDLQDPTLLSVLENLGWNEVEYAKTENSSNLLHDQPVHGDNPPLPKRQQIKGKAENERELLGMKALAPRRQGKSEEAEEELRKAKDLEYQFSQTEVTHPSKYTMTSSGDSSNLVPLTISENSTVSRVGEDNKEVKPIGIIENAVKLMDDLKSNDPALRRPAKLGKAKKLEGSDDLENFLPNMEDVKPSSISMTSDDFSASFPSGKQEDSGVIMNPDVDMLKLVTVTASMNENVSEDYSSMNLQKGSYPLGSENPPAFSPDVSQFDSLVLQPAKNIKPLPSSSQHSNFIDFDSGELRSKEEQTEVENMVTSREVSPSTNLLDLLTGDSQDLHNLYAKHQEKPADSTVRLDSQLCSEKDNTGSNKTSNRMLDTHIEKTLHGGPQRNLVPVTVANLTPGVDYPREQVLNHKRKAVALKREGKLAEAREELRQAKLLEKRLEGGNQHAGMNGESQQVDITSRNAPVYHPVKEEGIQGSSLETQKRGKQEHTRGRPLEPEKPRSGRERFKLQQESLARKRKALKLRREGRIEESDAEFELAKKLESQIEEMDGQTLGAGSSAVKADDDDAVESFLDPQLMSALKAIGWQEADVGMLSSSKPESKPEVEKEPRKGLGKNSSVSSNKTHIEQQIKAEKLRALNLKHAGKQAEALDALRSAKRLEKQLLSLDS